MPLTRTFIIFIRSHKNIYTNAAVKAIAVGILAICKRKPITDEKAGVSLVGFNDSNSTIGWVEL